VIQIKPDWREVMMEFRRRGVSDVEVLERLGTQGVTIDRANLCHLRSGKNSNPRFALGAALLNILEPQ
jgi:hypothetical protein